MPADTGVWLALASPRDGWHEAAVAATQQLSGPLVVTWPVIAEASYLLLTRSDRVQAIFPETVLSFIRAKACVAL